MWFVWETINLPLVIGTVAMPQFFKRWTYVVLKMANSAMN